jgi:hypothetical protein
LLATNPGDDTTYSDSGLNSGVTYVYTIAAYDGSPNQNASPQSSPASATTLTTADTTPPTIPSNLIATPVSPSQIDLSWNASTDASGIAGYKIYRDAVLLFTTIGSGTTYQDAGLSPSTTCSYTIAAYDASPNNNASAQSAPVVATTLPLSGSGLVAHYAFDEASGATVVDSSGNHPAGTLVNNPGRVPGRIGSGALSLDGNDDYVSLGDVLDFGANQDFTVSFWFKTADNAATQSWPAFVSKENASVAPRTGWECDLSTGNGNRLGCSTFVNGAQDYVYTTVSVNDNLWHHGVFVRNTAARRIELYLDGVLHATDQSIATGSLANATVLLAGARGPNSAAKYRVQSLLDDLRLYDRALGLSEVQALFTVGSGAASLAATAGGAEFETQSAVPESERQTAELHADDPDRPQPASALDASSLAAPSISLEYGALGNLQLTIRGTEGSVCVVESSPDLQHWTELLSHRLDVNPVSLPIPPGSEPARFYRLHSVPARE